MLRRVAESVVLLWGWKRLVLAATAGGVSVLALPPVGFPPVLLGTFPILVWLVDGTGRGTAAGWLGGTRRAFAVGWCFGFGYFLAGLWWLGEAFLVQPDVFAWLLPIGVAGLPAFLALYTGLGVALAHALWSRGPWRVAALAFGLGLSEYLRGTLFTGFPWNAFGYALAAQDVMMQAASLVGVHALTVLVVFIAAAPAVLLDPPAPAGRGRIAVPTIAAALVLGQLAYGAVRLAGATAATVDGVALRIVQPNLTQRERQGGTDHAAIIDRYLRLSTSPMPPISGVPRPTHVIWPESALPFTIEAGQGLFPRLARLLAPGAVLIAGIQRLDEGRTGKVFNSLYVFDHEARVLDRYDKVHLVPFGEYLPFPEIATAIGLEPLTRVLAFVAGTRRAPIATPGAPPFVPLICYEIIFPGHVTGDGHRPGWLINVSDDSWFGDTLGPRQHLHQARVRAVEEGLPVIRATTTGISAVIDGYGRVQAALGLGREGVLDAPLPVALPPTPASRAGLLPLIWALVTTLAVAVLARRSLRREVH
jgi:apolipoprotein N-acyltransferase